MVVQTHKNDISVSRLMGNLRALMVKDVPPKKRVNMILSLLCEELQMQTALLYVMRPGDILEKIVLAGRQIKTPDFVRAGELSVGQAVIQKQTIFELNPKATFKAIIAVPLIRGSQTVGALELVNKKQYALTDEIKDGIENVGMVLAEFLTDTALQKTDKIVSEIRQSFVFEGIPLVSGFAVGEVLQHHRFEQNGSILALHPKHELKRLNMAFTRVQNIIKKRLDSATTPMEEKEIFETYWMFLNDPSWKTEIIASIESGLTAEASLQKNADEMLEKMRSVSDLYLRERAHDFQDLIAKLMFALSGKKKNKKLTVNKILVADSLGAAELLDYDLKHIKGIILEDASQTSHVVIVARAYHIPLIGNIKNATRQIDDGTPVAIDAEKGRVYLRPSDEILDDLKLRQKTQQKWEKLYARNLDKTSETKDGHPVSLMLNMGVNVMANQGKLPPCDGIGLYRTELLFMTSKSLPDIKTQTEAYRRVLMLAKNKKVVFRTLDIGSDKVLPYFNAQTEENPAMGWRSIRMTLDRRSLLRDQLRALIRATAGKALYVMFPMVTVVSEFVEAKKTLMMELKAAQQHREKIPEKVYVGTMLEVPSLLFQLDNLLPLVDFISIGTNDLGQFIFAADRSNGMIANRYDVLSPAFLKVLQMIFETCHQYNVPCSVCGEMASHPLEAITLVGLGAKTLSMNPDAIGAVKTALRSLNMTEYQSYLQIQIAQSSVSLREALSSYLRDHSVLLGG